MSDGLFTKSIKHKSSDKKFCQYRHLELFAKRKFESEGFTKSVKSIKSNIEFLNDDVKKSVLSSEHLFTNYLSEHTPASISNRIIELFDNPSIVNNVRTDNVDINDKVRNCINLYHNISEDDNPVIIKSQLSDQFNEQVGVRVYIIVDIAEDGEKAEFKIVLIDPFHLVIPSKDKGKSKEIVEKENFHLNKNNRICMNDYFKKSSQFY